MKAGECRYFLALIPQEPLASEIYALKKKMTLDYNTKAALRSPAHLTLHMPFLWKERNEERLINLLAQSTKFEPFKLFLDGFGAFPPRTIYIKNKESAKLNAFHKALTLHTKRNVKLLNATHNRGFSPHITIAFRDLKKDVFPDAWSKFEPMPFEATMVVDSFWLLKHDGKQWLAHKEFAFNPSDSQ